MWIRKKEWEALLRRVEKLEAAKRVVDEQPDPWMFHAERYSGYWVGPGIHVHTLLRMILAHLGLKVESKPGTTELVRLPKPQKVAR